MPDFSNVRAQEVPRERTATYTLYRLEGQPSLEVKPATEANPAYMRAMLKESREMARRLKAGDISPEILEENRARDRKLFPAHVVVGWSKAPVDTSGALVPFSAEACREFIAALPYDIFNDLRDFCSNMDNFRTPSEVGRSDREALSGN